MHGSDCPESAEKEIALWFPGSFVLSSNKKSGRSKRTEFELVEEMVTYEMCDETCLQNDIPTRPQKSRDPYEFLYLPY
jgi:hypothetical protein